MKRKTFIGLAAVVAAGAAAGGYIFFENFEDLARKIIRKDTASLKIDPAEMDKFFKAVKDAGTWDKVFTNAHKQLVKWHYRIDNGLFDLPYATNYKVYRSKIVGTFLLSTDFFTNKMDTSKPVRFTTLFDPYKRPCSSPFSNLYYPEVNA